MLIAIHSLLKIFNLKILKNYLDYVYSVRLFAYETFKSKAIINL